MPTKKSFRRSPSERWFYASRLRYHSGADLGDLCRLVTVESSQYKPAGLKIDGLLFRDILFEHFLLALFLDERSTLCEVIFV